MNTPAKTTSATAIISLVSGILGWTFVPVLGSLVAIITGHMARAEIRRNLETIEGDGLAVAGLVLGWAMLGFCILAVLAILMFFGGLAAFIALVASHGH